jgi:hypothetical protein
MDGWNDMNKKVVINILVSSCKGSTLLDAIKHIEFSWRLFDPNEYVFEHLKNTIEIVGLNNVVQIITNNALNCKQMG